MHNLKKIIILFRTSLVICAFILFLWLFLKDFAPSGVLVLKNDFSPLLADGSNTGKDKQISDLYPHVRVREMEKDEYGDWFQNMYVDPVYFKVNPPREFYKAKLKIKYKTERQTFFQAGVKEGLGDLDFKFAPLEFLALDNLSWHKIRKNGLILYQKNRRYNSIDEFFENPPKDGRIAIYNMDMEILDSKKYRTCVLNLKTDLDYVSYIIADYVEPKIKDGWKFSEAEFDISRENFEDGRLIFILSAPNIDVNKGSIDISEIIVELQRPQFKWNNMIGEFKEYLRSVIDK